MSSMLLVNQREYSKWQACYWSTRENILNVMHAIGSTGKNILNVKHAIGSTRENILNVKHAIGQPERIFSMSCMLLVNQREYSQCHACYWVNQREYSQCQACYWSTRENILNVKHAIGQPERIFSMSRMLLVNRREYSQCQACYWSTRENILNGKHDIGQPERIFSMSSMLLVSQREYSQWQACYWSTGRPTYTDLFIPLMATRVTAVTAKTIAFSHTLVRGGGGVQSQDVPWR